MRDNGLKYDFCRLFPKRFFPTSGAVRALALLWVAATLCSPTKCDGQAANGNQATADPFAQSALDAIVGNMQREIFGGSSRITSGTTTIYTPATPAYAVPVRSGSFPVSTLVRSSARNDSVSFPGVASEASSVNSATDAATGGYTVDPATWNRHFLIPRANPNGTFADSTPVAGFTAPDWVFVTDQGPTVLVSPTTSVVGRYAYAIYDEGALLDANVAGYPSGVTGTQAGGKGVLAFADLTQLGLTQAQVDQMVGWRNYATAQPTGIFPNYSFDAAAATRYCNAVISNTNGFLAPNGTATFNGQSDQMFTSRQGLINLFTAIGITPNALQYLGTFSRALTAPSWCPSANAANMPGYDSTLVTGTALAYKDNAETAVVSGTGNPNRDVPNVRWPNAATITHYDDKGLQTTYDVQAGDPMLQRRFSLAKLNWLRYDGPNSAAFDPSLTAQQQSDAIIACFGLQWDATNWRWEYAANRTGPAAIMTLAEVADPTTPKNVIAPVSPREPNFFELLKAGILAGSLGRDPGPGIDKTRGIEGVYANFINGSHATDPNFKSEPNLHILQIGANIIDQFDSDSYPTAIHFNAWGLTGANDLALQTVYGEENLPCLSALCMIAVADPAPVVANDPYAALKFFLQPQLWNPHQVPVTKLTGYPSGFQAYGYGKAQGAYCLFQGPYTMQLAPMTKYDDGTRASGTVPVGSDYKLGRIYFNDTGDKTSPFYNHPCLLTLNLTSTDNITTIVSPIGTGAEQNPPNTCCYSGTTSSGTRWDNLAGDSGSPNQFAGFAFNQYGAGYGSGSGIYNVDPTTYSVEPYLLPDPTAMLFLSLRYKGTDGNYHPYNFMARMTQSNRGSGDKFFHNTDGGLAAGRTRTGGWGAVRPDPRTDRFSEACQWWDRASITSTMSPGPNGYGSYPIYGPCDGANEDGAPISPSFGYSPAFPNSTFATMYFYPHLWALNDKTATSGTYQAYYADPDGVVRYGDSYRMNSVSGDGCQMYHLTSAASSAQARRPVILNRPFRSVGEIGFAYRDLPYKSVDLWSPTSGDAALLDLFSMTDQLPMAAGQINPNNAPAPVLKAVFAGVAKNDAIGILMSSTDAGTLAAKVAADLNGTSANGPYVNRADLATRLGPLVSQVSGTTAAFITGTTSNSYANWANKAYAEAPMRALTDVTNTRTWNLLIDVVAQTGTFSPSAPATPAALASAFNVQGETHYWLHVAIDRYTGQIVDQSLEQVPASPILSTCTVAEEQTAGTTVGTIAASGSAGSTLTYTLVNGTGGDDNAAFTISGNTFQTTAAFQYLTKNTYNVRVRATDQNGVSIEQPITITVNPSPYTQWKIGKFQGDASNPAVAGDTVSPSGDGIPNLLKYATGLDPTVPGTLGIAATVSGTMLTMHYTRGSAATDATVHPCWSSDLATWSTSGVQETMLSDDGTIQPWQATVPIDPGTPRLFMRLQVTRP